MRKELWLFGSNPENIVRTPIKSRYLTKSYKILKLIHQAIFTIMVCHSALNIQAVKIWKWSKTNHLHNGTAELLYIMKKFIYMLIFS